MALNIDQIVAVIGAKELEIIALRMEVNRLLQKYEPQERKTVAPGMPTMPTMDESVS